jgi:hypothetical protein
MKCISCGKESSNRWTYYQKQWYCGEHTPPFEFHIIQDATGKTRDREWLKNKLDLTRSDSKWKDDIRKRKIGPKGEVVRQ